MTELGLSFGDQIEQVVRKMIAEELELVSDKAPSPKEPGCWVIYGYDVHADAYEIFADRSDALEEFDRKYSGLGSYVAFWPFGMELREAINKWDEIRRQEKKARDSDSNGN